MVCILVKNGYEKRTILKQWEDLTYSKVSVFPVQKAKTFDVQTKDHISLATDVYLPVNKIRVNSQRYSFVLLMERNKVIFNIGDLFKEDMQLLYKMFVVEKKVKANGCHRTMK